MKVYRIFFLFATVLSIASCGLVKPTDFSLIKIGMTKEQVIEKIGKPRQVVSAKKYDDGIMEIYEYPLLKATPDTLQNWLYFFNNELQEWGPKEQYIPNDYDRYYRKDRRDRN